MRFARPTQHLLVPPVFWTDEIEGLNPKDLLYAGALAVVGLFTPIIRVPTATGTMIKPSSGAALDTYRLSLSTNRPAVSTIPRCTAKRTATEADQL
jgi:hypothetical protein